MKFYPNNCQKCYEVVKLYDVRLLLLLELGELKGWAHARDGEGGDGLTPERPWLCPCNQTS